MNPIQAARAAGQQIWLDNLSRALINQGLLARHIENGVAGVTTNPAIFQKAIAEGQDYRPALDAMRSENLNAEQRYERLVIEDVQRACDAIRPVFEASNRVIRLLRSALGAAYPIIGVGGVLSGADAVAKREAGADLVQVYTGLIYRGPALVPECAQALARG